MSHHMVLGPFPGRGARGSAPRRISVSRSSEPDEHTTRLRGWSMDCAQVSPGRFLGRLVDIQLDHVQILRDTTNVALVKQGQAWDGAIVFSIPIGARGEGRLGGDPLAFPACLVAEGHDLPELVTPPCLDLVCVAADRAWLQGLAQNLGDPSVLRRLRGRSVRLRGRDVLWRRIQAAAGDIFGDVAGLERTLVDRRAGAALEEMVGDLLLDLLAADQGETVDACPPRKRIVDDVRAYVLDHADMPPTVEDICRHFAISRRTLQNCFQSAFGCSPKQFLRIVRLNRVRRALREAAAVGPVSIGDVAASWGFWHWSRFAGEYRDLFGELPSQTVRACTRGSDGGEPERTSVVGTRWPTVR